ncbi:GNAT family N-acetyltransferase [Nocardioides aquiterrae]|uniref:GNAT family N-acetyltransferase n=1 Tax=Nocardioides aquiterrae TaxID=203799 RepID=A0ABP4EV42_9ACTN
MAPDTDIPELKIVGMPFAGLDAETLYAICQVRQAVFVVEQECPYPDLDGRDLEPGTQHVTALLDDVIVGYARVLDDGDVWRIGRVLLTPPARGKGLADPLMQASLGLAQGRDVVLDAQTPLVDWYATFGFQVDGPEFLEDGIPHTPMRLSRGCRAVS